MSDRISPQDAPRESGLGDEHITRAHAFDPKHPDLGWQVSAPEPYWSVRWPLFWRDAPQCWDCKRRFKTRLDYESHWVRGHA